MNAEVNGADRQIAEGSTLADLVAELGYGNRMVVIERNGEPVERARFGEIVVEDGDVIEIVRAVAGG